MNKFKELSQELNNNSILLYSGYYNFDEEITPFQVDHNFFYLTQLEIPNLAILFHHLKKQLYFFVKFHDPVWFDNCSTLNTLRDKFFDQESYQVMESSSSLVKDYLSNCELM